jgi:hypothetical protein
VSTEGHMHKATERPSATAFLYRSFHESGNPIKSAFYVILVSYRLLRGKLPLVGPENAAHQTCLAAGVTRTGKSSHGFRRLRQAARRVAEDVFYN